MTEELSSSSPSIPFGPVALFRAFGGRPVCSIQMVSIRVLEGMHAKTSTETIREVAE
jgi:hypothetical protein